MCGIITIIRKDKRLATKQLLKTYERQKSRGTEGYGYISFSDAKMEKLSRAEYEKDIKIRLEKESSTGIFFHHRTPTSTPNYKELTHPICVTNKNLKHDYYIIHNGIITNDTELRTLHEKDGYVYTTICKKIYETGTTRYTSEQFNDSESLAIELAKAIDSNGIGIQNVTGSIAFMCMQLKKGTKSITGMYYGRNTGNPLKLDNNNDFLKIASEGTGELIDTDILYKIDLKTNEISERDFNCGKLTSYTSYSNDDYDYYSRKHYPSRILESDFEVNDDDSIIDRYLELPKNENGYVWITGNETYDELAMLWSRYDYELNKAQECGYTDKADEYKMKQSEIDEALEYADYKTNLTN